MANSAKTAGKKRAQKKGPPVPEVLWTVRVSLAVSRLRQTVVQVLQSAVSTDRPTRWMSFVFLGSLICAALVVGVAGSRYRDYLQIRRQAALSAKQEESAFSDFLKKQAEQAHRKNVMFPLGQFTLELRAPAGELRPAKGVMNLAEIEVVLECDTKDTRFFFEDNLPQARNQVTNVFVAMDRGELLSQDGKLRLKRRLIEKLNSMLIKGRVENLYFSKLILS